MANDTATLIDTKRFLEILTRSLIVRYMFTPGNPSGFEHLVVEIVGASSIPGTIFRFKSNIYMGAEFSPSEFDFGSEEVNAVSERLSFILDDWKTRAVMYPWWIDWLQPKSFVGILLLGNGMRREVEASNPNLLFYHGVLAQQIVQHKNHLELSSRHDKHPIEREALNVLARRFSAFVAQAQHTHVAQTIGTSEPYNLNR